TSNAARRDASAATMTNLFLTGPLVYRMSHDANRFQFTADRGDARLRLDQALVRRVGREVRLSRTQAQQWIGAGLVALNDRTARRPSQSVPEGARVVITLPAGTIRRAPPGAEALPLDVLYEDRHLLAVNKPAGVVVHPTYKHGSHTIINAVLWRLRDEPEARPGVLTRLDKDTSGLVLVALSPAVHAAVQAEARAGRVRKQYVAAVTGRPTPRRGSIRLPLGRDPQDRRLVVHRTDGAASETRYEVLSTTRGTSVVLCELVTGRTHQIRVHLAASGWPIIGDRTYGTASDAIARQALHAWRVELRHPVTGQSLRIVAPPPPDIEALVGHALVRQRSLGGFEAELR
ncbi:MAG TPA: RluA family pseudouridine synthase, partial [Vicinamibacterales bacterium]